MAARGDDAPHSVIIPIPESRTSGSASTPGGVIGTDSARFYAPSLPDSKGIVIRGARLFIAKEVGAVVTTSAAVFDIMNQTTTMLSATVSAVAIGSTDFTLANNGREIITPGRYVRIDCVNTALNTTLGFTGMSVQLDYDRL